MLQLLKAIAELVGILVLTRWGMAALERLLLPRSRAERIRRAELRSLFMEHQAGLHAEADPDCDACRTETPVMSAVAMYARGVITERELDEVKERHRAKRELGVRF